MENNNIGADVQEQPTTVTQDTTVNVDAMDESEFEDYLAGEYGADEAEQADDGQHTEPSTSQVQDDTQPSEQESEVQETQTQPFRTFSTQNEWQNEIDRIIGDRLKTTRETVKQHNRLASTVADFYGVDEQEALSMLEEELQQQIAEKKGVDVDFYKEHTQLKEQSEAYRKMQADAQKQQDIRMQQMQWQQESDTLRKAVPDFDFLGMVEASPVFRSYIERRYSVQDAYYLAQRDEQVANLAAQQERRMQRKQVKENVSLPSSGGATVRDVSRFTDEQFEQYLQEHMN